METEEEHVVLFPLNIMVKHIQHAFKMVITNSGVELQAIARSGENACQVLFVHASLIQNIRQIKLLIRRIIEQVIDLFIE